MGDNSEEVFDINMDDFGDIDDVEQSLRELDQSSPAASTKEGTDEPEIDLSMPKLSTESLLSMDFDEDDTDSFEELKELEDSLGESSTKTLPLKNALDDEDDDEDDEDIEDWDLSIVKSKLKSLAIPIIIIIVVVLFLATALGKKTASTPTDVTVQSNPNMLNTGLFETSEPIAVDTKRQQDYIIAYKFMFTWNDLCQPVIKGELTKIKEETKEKRMVEIPVDVETFNSIKDGQIITVYYDELTFNNNQYITNITLGEVVGE